jgi:hypothetical protein
MIGGQKNNAIDTVAFSNCLSVGGLGFFGVSLFIPRTPAAKAL